MHVLFLLSFTKYVDLSPHTHTDLCIHPFFPLPRSCAPWTLILSSSVRTQCTSWIQEKPSSIILREIPCCPAAPRNTSCLFGTCNQIPSILTLWKHMSSCTFFLYSKNEYIWYVSQMQKYIRKVYIRIQPDLNGIVQDNRVLLIFLYSELTTYSLN